MDYVECVYERLDSLYDIGARNFVLLNIAPLNYAPMYALPENGGTIDTQYWLDEDKYATNAYVATTQPLEHDLKPDFLGAFLTAPLRPAPRELRQQVCPGVIDYTSG